MGGGTKMITKLSENTFVRTSHIQQMQSVVHIRNHTIYVFDPGYFDDEVREIREFVLQQEERLGSPTEASGAVQKRLILTHSDYDHIVGVPYFDEYEVWAASTWDADNEARSIAQIRSFDSEFYVDRPWVGDMKPILIRQRLEADETREGLYFFHAKGHTSDGLVTVWNHTAVVGDYLSALEFPFIYTSIRDYIGTMAMFRKVFTDHDVDLVIVQHGPHATGKVEINHRIETSEDYLQQLVNLVQEGEHKGYHLDEVLAHSARITFDGKPLSPGIARFHKENVELSWKELASRG